MTSRPLDTLENLIEEEKEVMKFPHKIDRLSNEDTARKEMSATEYRAVQKLNE